ncbi:AAA family ATPase [Desulfococcaceae bacterium HSG9]|nr:AAA family ATPase [Desulfococcaceae bacterium HSG9]
MKIKSLILRDFGIFKGRTDFDLDNDLVVISGGNYTGKTTLARALYFVLCGKVLTAGLKLKDLKTAGAASATAGLVYTHSDQIFRTYRSTDKRVQNEIYQHQNWKIIPANAPAYPLLNPEQWRIGCFLKEDELGELLVKTPAGRRDMLNQILGVDQLLRLQKTFIEVRRISKRKVRPLLAQQESLYFGVMPNGEAELQAAKTKVAALEAEVRLPDDRDAKRQLGREWTHQKKMLDERLKKLFAEREHLLTGFQNAAELPAALEETGIRLAGREKQELVFEKIKEKRITLSAELKRTEALLADTAQLQDKQKCPTCHQEIAETHLATLESRWRRQYDKIEIEIAQIKDKEREAEAALQSLVLLAQRETDLNARAERLKIVKKEINDLHLQIDALKFKIASAGELHDDKTDRSEINRQLEQARENLSKFEKQHILYIENQKLIKRVNTQAHLARRNQLLCEWIADALNLTLQSAIGSSAASIAASVEASLQDFNLFHSQNIATDLQKSGLTPEVDNRPFHTLSGSEKAILYLSMKIALARLTPGADFIVTDNPTAHLDTANRDLMAKYLARLALEKQVIVLTNDSDFAAQLDDQSGDNKKIVL